MRPVRWTYFADWWSSAASPGSQRLLAVILIVAPILVAAMGLPRLHIYGHDIFIALDGAWRVVNGQRPGVDFFGQMGPCYYLLHAAGLILAGNAARGLAYSTAIATALLGLWSFVLLRWRMRAYPFFLACLFLALLAAAPFPLGHSPWQASFSMKHNRYGFALLGLVMLEGFLPAGGNGRRLSFWGGCSTGIACAAAMFMKISFGLVGIGFAVLSLIPPAGTRIRAAGIVTGFAAFAVPMLAYLRFDVPALLTEYRWLAAARGRDAGISSLFRVLYHDRFELAPLLLLSLLVCLLPGLPIRRSVTLLIIVLSATLAGAMLMATNTSQYYGAPLADVAALLLLNELANLREHRMLTAPMIALGLLVVAIPMSIDAAGQAIALKDKIAGSQPGYRLSPPHLADLQFVRCEETQFGYPCSPNDNGEDFVRYTEEGLDLLRAHSQPEETVRGLGMSNPFTYALLRPPPRGGSVVISFTNVREDSVPPEELLTGDVGLLLLPKFQATERSIMQAVLKRYPHMLGREFRMAAESANWVLYRRAK